MVLELISPDGLVLRRVVIRCGYRDRHLAQLVKGGHLVRIRQGAYALTSIWERLDARGRQLLLSKAVMLQYDDGVALSHASAAQLWGGPGYGLDLARVHLTHFDGGGRRSAGLVHHAGECRVDDISRMNGHWLTSPARTVLDVTALHGVEAGVILGDDFVHRGLTTPDEIRRLAVPMEFWPSTLTQRIVLDLIDGASESVGETLFRLLCRTMNIARPELQWEVVARNGRLVGRSDFVWHFAKTMGEFDGRTKYLESRRPGETIEDAVLREKRREDEMRELTGYRMIRFVWADLFDPMRTAARLRAVLTRTA
jgi:hypothetical protein